MLKKRGKIVRGLIVIGSAIPSIGGFARGLWASEGGKKWLAPLVVFLCVTGLVLVLAASVEALAPFIYTILSLMAAAASSNGQLRHEPVPTTGRPFTLLLACPACKGDLGDTGSDLVCKKCEASYGVRDGIPDLRVVSEERTETVRTFYSRAPFPNYPPNDTLSGLRGRAARSEFARLLEQAIPGDATVLELGCGTGQMSLFLATADRVILGADLTRASLELGARAAARYGLDHVRFVETDLRSPGLLEGAFDVVYSSGVLHHTPDPRASFASMARLVRPGGILVLGLYNAYARFPHLLRRAVAKLTNNKLIPFDPVLRARDTEPERRRAWLFDQYEHPEEHRHTTAEVQRWFEENGVEYVRTYPDSLIAAEPLVGAQLFEPAEDDWGFENVLSQIGWAKSLSYEGGLWVTIGRRRGQAKGAVDGVTHHDENSRGE